MTSISRRLTRQQCENRVRVSQWRNGHDMPFRYLLSLVLGLFLASSVGYDYGAMFGLVIGAPVLVAIVVLYLWLRHTGSEASWVWQAEDSDGRALEGR